MLACENLGDMLHWEKRSIFPQEAQKGCPARPQRVKGRRVPSGVRGGSDRCENAGGGLFQHPASGLSRHGS
jgi:hypothetical protein